MADEDTGAEATTDTEAAVEQIVNEAGGDAPAPAEAPAPELNEALREMNAKLDALASPPVDPLDQLMGAFEEEDDGGQNGAAPQPQAPPSEDDALEGELRELIREEARNLVEPVFAQQEQNRRVHELRALQEEFPRLREEEVVTEVAADLDEVAASYGLPHLRTDPRLVRMAYQAYEARAAAQAETPAEAASGGGATLEQGAGPGAPEPEVDPIQQEYDRVFRGAGGGDDPLTR